MLKALVLFCTICSVVPMPPHDLNTPRPGERCGYESCQKTEKGVLNVHIVPHTHDDVGWLKTVDQYYYGSRNNIQKAGVQYILDSVIKELWEDPRRRFIYVETAFFWKWWMRQPASIQQKVHTLVRQGRLQFVGGAWSMNDEAATHYQSTMDQFTWGLSKLNKTFGRCGLPRVGWQIDPFGHAREFASLLAGMGYDGLFLGRIDYQDKTNRKSGKTMEMLWRGDDDLGKASDIFTGILYNTYSPPSGFCFDVLCSDEPIIDDPSSPLFNVDERVSEFLATCYNMSEAYATDNILVTMGEDFHYQDAAMWYTNLDKLIEYTNMKAAKDGLNVKLFYSTPDCYLKAVKDANPTLPTKQDDFFPYASDPTAFWTGYFTSKPTTKYFEREGNNYLQAVKQLQLLAALEDHNMFMVNELKSAMGIMQHHDAVTGTEKDHVTHDYERLLDQAIEDALMVAKQAFNKITQGSLLQPPTVSYQRCHFNESRCGVTESSQKFIVTVYNPLAWTLDATPVRLPVVDGSYSVFGPDGKAVTTQLLQLPQQVLDIPTRVSKATHELVYLAEDVPGLGFKSYYIKREGKRSKRDVELNDEETAIFKELKRKNYYENVNNYWKNIKEDNYVDVKNIEDGQHVKLTDKNEPNLVFLKAGVIDHANSDLNLMFLKKRFADTDAETENHGQMDLEVLKDKKNMNRDVGELEKILREARVKLLKTTQRSVKKDMTGTLKSRLNDDEMRMLSDDPRVVERYPDDSFLENELIKLRINNTTGQITHAILPDGTETPFSIQMLYYPGCVGNNEVYENRSSGAYIFRPNATKATELSRNDSKVFKGPLVDEVHISSSDYTSNVIRIYKNSKLNFIENEWLVGPIPIHDDMGKEIIVRYVTDIVNNGAFYTDSNGRQMLKRRLNQRPQWNLTLEEPIAGNYYPVTNKIYIEDDGKRLAVLTDRSEGGSSLLEGNLELMLHRRLLHDDAFGVGEPLNETAKGVGLVARGKHRIYLSKPSDKEAVVNEKKSTLEGHLQPLVMVADARDTDFDQWLKMKNVYSGVKHSLPVGLHLLTLEPWDGSLLLRLENYLEKSDKKDSSVKVDMGNLFKNLKIKTLRETTLSANQWLKDYKKWSWKKETDFSDNFNREYGSFQPIVKAEDRDDDDEDQGLMVKVKAKQIRTFVADYDFVVDF